MRAGIVREIYACRERGENIVWGGGIWVFAGIRVSGCTEGLGFWFWESEEGERKESGRLVLRRLRATRNRVEREKRGWYGGDRWRVRCEGKLRREEQKLRGMWLDKM